MLAVLLATTLLSADLTPICPVEQNLIYYTNQQRKQAGVPELQVDETLMASARQHCEWMAANGRLQHTRANVAENIACGQASSREAVQDWMRSAGHRRNLLNGRYRFVGVAAFVGANRRIYWCQQFR